MMATRLKIGPADHGRELSEDEAELAEYEEGYCYEHIDGRIEVAPAGGLSEGFIESWVFERLQAYGRTRPDVFRYMHSKARIFVPGRKRPTRPEPDVTLFSNHPADFEHAERHWENLIPILTVEILVHGDPEKDLVRNVELYWQVPSILEYWIVDGRGHPDEPTLITRRRGTKRWIVAEVPFGEIYTSPVLPGFELIVDPKR